MRFLVLPLALLCALVLIASATAGPLTVCDAGGHACRPGSLADAARLGPSFVLKQTVDPATFGSPLPVAVTVIAMADSEITWNGAPLARNGDPYGAGRSGRFVFTVIVPRDRVRPGPNEVTLRLKRPADGWPIASPVHMFRVAPYADPRLEAFGRYLPAMLMGGALGAAALWFGVAYALDRTERGARLLALAAGGAAAQLTLETARIFIDYPHAWQPPRLALIAVLGAFVGLMLARYAAWRFAPGARDKVTAACAVAVVGVLIFTPGFDVKTLGAFAICLATIAGLAGWALARGARLAIVALVGALAALAWMAHDGAPFLDRGYYVALGGVFLALTIEQAASIRRRAEPPPPDAPSEPTTWRVVTGARVRFEPIATVAVLTADDDYTHVRFTDGRTCLHTASLAQAVASGAGAFLRVHRSHAVNRHLVKASEPRPGGGLRLTLEGGSTVPVGRTFQRAVREALSLSPPSRPSGSEPFRIPDDA